jgi:hypothetical protein
MSIVQTVCTSAKADMLTALAAHTLRMALYTSSANLDAATGVYLTSGEVVGSGYTAGGAVLTGVVVHSEGVVAFLDFDDVVWTNSTITARAALIYDSTNAGKSIAVLDFGADKTSSGTPLTVQIPLATATTSLIRIQ